MDQITLLEKLERFAGVCRRLGLSGLLGCAGESAQSLLDELRQLDFAIFMIDEVHRGLKPVDSRIETAKYVNLYCIRESQ